MLCRFHDVLYLDVDVTPMRDLAYLFTHTDYNATGNLFFPDIYWKGMVQDSAFEFLGGWMRKGQGACGSSGAEKATWQSMIISVPQFPIAPLLLLKSAGS
jgi:hypothetical protein